MNKVELVLSLLSVTLVLFLALVVLPRSVVRPLPPSAVAGIGDPVDRLSVQNERLKLRNDVRTTCLSFIGSIALIAGVLITFEQARASQRSLAESLETSRQQLSIAQQTVDNQQYIDNVKNLGDGHAAVAVAAIEVLDDIAQRDDTRRIEVHSILQSYIHQSVPWPPAAGDQPAGAEVAAMPFLEARHPAASLALLRLGSRALAKTITSISDRDFRKANLQDLNFSDDEFTNVHLAGSLLNRTDLTGALFLRSDLSGTNLSGAKLCATNLSSANLAAAELSGAVADADTVWPEDFDHVGAGVLQSQTPDCTTTPTAEAPDD